MGTFWIFRKGGILEKGGITPLPAMRRQEHKNCKYLHGGGISKSSLFSKNIGNPCFLPVMRDIGITLRHIFLAIFYDNFSFPSLLELALGSTKPWFSISLLKN